LLHLFVAELKCNTPVCFEANEPESLHSDDPVNLAGFYRVIFYKETISITNLMRYNYEE